MTKRIPKKVFFALLITLLAFLVQIAVYGIARWIAGGWAHTDITTPLDRSIPLIPWTVAIYFGCYLFWILNYYICAAGERAQRDRFFCADTIAKLICFVIFLAFPTTNTRPEIHGSGIWDHLMRLLYRIDSPDNLFPSIHCLVGWFCWIGVRGRRDIPAWYKWVSLMGAIAVCISTLTTVQHVIADVICGVLLSEVCWQIAGHAGICRPFSQGIDWILRRAERSFSSLLKA